MTEARRASAPPAAARPEPGQERPRDAPPPRRAERRKLASRRTREGPEVCGQFVFPSFPAEAGLTVPSGAFRVCSPLCVLPWKDSSASPGLLDVGVSHRVTSQLCEWKLREGQRAREPGGCRCGREGRARPGRRHTGTFQRCRIPAARCEKPCVGKVESVLPPPLLPGAEGGRPKSLLWSRATMVPGKEPEFQRHVYNYAEDTNIQEDSFKEENPKGTSTSTNKDQLVLKCVRQPPRRPPLIHCSGEMLKFMEMSLANSTAMESSLNPSQPRGFLCEENLPSKGIQNSTDIPEMSVRHQKEVAVEGRKSPEIVSTWSPTGISWSGGASWEDCMTPDREQSLESSQPLEEDMALNEVLRKLKRTNKEQQTLIQDLQHRNMYLEKKIEELQMKTTKQHVFVDIINKLKENVEELIEDKYRVMLEKNDTQKKLQNLHEILVNTQKHLQESRNEKETLQLEFKKIKGNYVSLQERYMTEMQQKNKAANQCMEMDRALSKKEEEVERLQQLKGELEKATTSALDLLKKEKETREQEFLSLQEEFQKREKENLGERQKLKSRLEKLVAQVQNLQFISDNEKAKNTELQQQINKVKNENSKLQQQVARSEEQNYVPQCETAQLKENLEEGTESDMAKGAKMIHSNLFLNHSPCEGESPNPPDVKRTSQLTSKIRNLLALMVQLLMCQDITNPDARHFKENEKVNDIILQKLKSFHLKKKKLDKEVTDFDSNEAKNVREVPVLLGAKLDQYHNLNEELDFLVTSCEEIIECADRRLMIPNSQIAHLEERNKLLEDLIRRPRERARKPRSENSEKHPKSMTVMPDILEGNRNDLD
ncbi:PREDICTED: cancer-associated gene 1 protein [Lipotes vexillifer]|uniref:Cancer-associated gene 1 protein n=1 Tax=Lipotes vexillifer TaxID=118797 RepID=A0A340Y1X9_LIPVE|nr:PREDICTED: cancer-associated gene 1 protein [Lipotes vexillifer]